MVRKRGRKRVLVVDDDESVRRIVKRWLTDAGCAVSLCDNFAMARQQLVASPPDVLLTDVRLGAYNGLQLVILAKDQRPDMLAIVMSAYDDPVIRKEAAHCGARYLLKPFGSENVLGSLIGRTQASPAAVLSLLPDGALRRRADLRKCVKT
jgi:DNA-binding NtrC family response regulator